MTATIYTTINGFSLTGHIVDRHIVDSEITIIQDGVIAGAGTVSSKGRIEDCPARLGAPDGGDTYDAYMALECEIAGILATEAGI